MLANKCLLVNVCCLLRKLQLMSSIVKVVVAGEVWYQFKLIVTVIHVG